MKIAVYTIALNEEKHVKRWYESAKEADLLLIADTGSTDKTRFLAKSLGISVTEIEVTPWRFDVARNASLALIPEDFDMCIQLDMDEVLPEGWRTKVEEAFNRGNTWPIYKHVTNRDSDGKPRNYQHYFKIHPRLGFFWKYPIHEVLIHQPNLSFQREFIDLEVDHIKDASKSRKSYLGLLEKAVEEEPTDWRMNHYLNREYFYNRDWLKVLQSAYKCEAIASGWDVERASTYMWASEAAHHLKMPPLAEEWAKKATYAAPTFYEVWHWRAHIAHLNEKWFDCLDFSSKRLVLTRQDHHLVKSEIWEWWGYDLIALASHKIGNHFDAVRFGKKAVDANPNNHRLSENLKFYVNSFNLMFEYDSKGVIKLQNFPHVYFINLEDSKDRLENIQQQFRIYGISNFEKIVAERSKRSHIKDTHNSITKSHLRALKCFLTNSKSQYAIICEDDIRFELSNFWNFDWNFVVNLIEKYKIEILQLSLICSEPSLILTGLHIRREGIDWSSGIYLVNRNGADKIVEKLSNKNSWIGNTESDLFNDLTVFTWALFDTSIEMGSTFHEDHIEKFHKPSFSFLQKSFITCEQ